MKKSLAFVIATTALLVMPMGISFGKKSKTIKILILGDSHSTGTFGRTLHKLMQSQKNVDVRSVAICGAMPRNFLAKKMYVKCGSRIRYTTGDSKWKSTSHITRKYGKKSLISRILSGKNILEKEKATLPEFEADIAIIALGSNNIYAGLYRKNMRELISATGASKCILVGPPKLPRDLKWKNEYIRIKNEKGKNGKYLLKRMYRSEKRVNRKMSKIKGCSFIDSRKVMKKYPYGGIHYGISNSKKWARGVFNRIVKLQESHH
jgi:hypothetical protein